MRYGQLEEMRYNFHGHCRGNWAIALAIQMLRETSKAFFCRSEQIHRLMQKKASLLSCGLRECSV